MASLRDFRERMLRQTANLPSVAERMEEERPKSQGERWPQTAPGMMVLLAYEQHRILELEAQLTRAVEAGMMSANSLPDAWCCPFNISTRDNIMAARSHIKELEARLAKANIDTYEGCPQSQAPDGS